MRNTQNLESYKKGRSRWINLGKYQLRDNFNRQNFKRIKSVKNQRMICKYRKEMPDAAGDKRFVTKIHCIQQLIELAR